MHLAEWCWRASAASDYETFALPRLGLNVRAGLADVSAIVEGNLDVRVAIGVDDNNQSRSSRFVGYLQVHIIIQNDSLVGKLLEGFVPHCRRHV